MPGNVLVEETVGADSPRLPETEVPTQPASQSDNASIEKYFIPKIFMSCHCAVEILVTTMKRDGVAPLIKADNALGIRKSREL